MQDQKGVYELSAPDEENIVLEKIRILLKEQGLDLEAELFPENIMSKGVQGDEGTYTRVLVLKGVHPGNETLAEISTKISNLVMINRVTFELAKASH